MGDTRGAGDLDTAKGRATRPTAGLLGYCHRDMLRLAMRRPWRQTEGMLRSIIQLLGLDLAVPDHTTWRNRSGAAGAADAFSPRTGSHAQEVGLRAAARPGAKVW